MKSFNSIECFEPSCYSWIITKIEDAMLKYIFSLHKKKKWKSLRSQVFQFIGLLVWCIHDFTHHSFLLNRDTLILSRTWMSLDFQFVSGITLTCKSTFQDRWSLMNKVSSTDSFHRVFLLGVSWLIHLLEQLSNWF
jgi:hypothetical protein